MPRPCTSTTCGDTIARTSRRAIVHAAAYAHAGDDVPHGMEHVVGARGGRAQKRLGRSGVNVTGPKSPDGSGVHCAAVNKPSGPRFARETRREVGVVELLPRHAAPVEIGDAVGHQIRHFHLEGVGVLDQILRHFDAEPRTDESAERRPVEDDARTLAHAAEIEPPARRSFRVDGTREGDRIARRPGEVLHVVARQFGPRAERRVADLRRQRRAAGDEVEQPATAQRERRARRSRCTATACRSLRDRTCARCATRPPGTGDTPRSRCPPRGCGRCRSARASRRTRRPSARSSPVAPSRPRCGRSN